VGNGKFWVFLTLYGLTNIISSRILSSSLSKLWTVLKM
jgi:hypothetical protein